VPCVCTRLVFSGILSTRQHLCHPTFSLADAGLDYLSSPSTVIKAAQDLAAAAFGSQHTWFLVNGCSVAVHAAVMATVKPGHALLLARNCHLSAFSACVLSDAVPVWLQPEQDSLHDIAHCITPQQLQHGFDVAKARGLNVGAVLAVSPTYYGAVARVSGMPQTCR
jgi:arginine/lysine/ornithine decarboxylase